MHAYDRIPSPVIGLPSGRAEDGEKFTTPDGQERTVDSSVLHDLRCRQSRGIAGIMAVRTP